MSRARPAVTVAAIVEREGRFLLVEEATRDGLRLNQPAGHVEGGETLAAAVARETLEEAAWTVVAREAVGLYMWQSAGSGATYLRIAYAADALAHDAARALDEGIVRALWMTRDEIAASRAQHRSPLVERCVDDYLAGQRLPPGFITDLAGTPV
ncbi:MAG: NUDIX hydrolase [Proteobacteria bacterium]|nr:NUDIX hydrolase [Pseudomonadota bacterium]